jgi:F-type H+-transporting ATPase subunit delta
VAHLVERLFGGGKDDRVRGYASAIVAVAEAEDALGTVEDELYAFARGVEQQPRLREVLGDRSLPVDNRKAVVHEVLGDRAHPVTVTLISFLVEAGRARDIGKIADDVAGMAAERRQQQVAEVRSAVALTEEQRGRLEQALGRATGRQIEVKVIVDPTIVGGVVARVGDEVFDGSIASRLDDAKQALGS